MSKGLEALEKLKECLYLDGTLDNINKERITIIEKELKALEIIKKYVGIDVLSDIDGELFMYSIRDKQYISSRSCLVMSDEEYNLLKEVLKND